MRRSSQGSTRVPSASSTTSAASTEPTGHQVYFGSGSSAPMEVLMRAVVFGDPPALRRRPPSHLGNVDADVDRESAVVAGVQPE